MVVESPYFGRDLEAMARARNLPRWIMGQFRPFVGRRVIEVGAGCGNFTPLIAETAPERLLCVEPSANMVALLRRRVATLPEARVAQGVLSDVPGWIDWSPDTIFYINVLEHIEDDGGEIRMAFDLIAPGGHILVFVPALRWLFGSADRSFGHFRRYGRRDLRGVIENAGFQIRALRYFDIAGVIPWFVLFRVFRLRCFTPGQVTLFDRLVVPVLRRAETLMAPPIGKNLVCVARRPVECAGITGAEGHRRPGSAARGCHPPT
ncbi:MAG: class I SAM-dependent methyltransferase [Verrucomicrobiae bacterium]|nr:class I SAM-dependent methyltransferase [Verrucomicrobiae bacterium]